MFTAISVFLSVSAYQAHQEHVKVIYKYVQLAQFKKKCFARLYIWMVNTILLCLCLGNKITVKSYIPVSLPVL